MPQAITVARRVLFTGLAYLLALIVVAAMSFFMVMVLAGPHAGLLPGWLEGCVLAAGWLLVIVLPIRFAVMMWKRLGNQPAR